MKKAIIISLALVFATTAGIAMNVPVAEAQQYTTAYSDGRGGSWEFILPIMFADSTTITGQGGSSVKINSDWNTGFGFGYNFNDHFQMNGQFTFAYRSYQATIVQTDGIVKKYNGEIDTNTIALNGVYYIMKGNVTPFVSGGIGMTYIDTNIPNGVGSSVCWFDPWWGYQCSTYVPTKTQTDVSYNAGLGVRWDINSKFALQGSYNKMWIDVDNAAGGMPDFDLYRMDFIFRM